MKLVLMLLLFMNHECFSALYSIRWSDIDITMEGDYRVKINTSDIGIIDSFELTSIDNKKHSIESKLFDLVKFPDFRFLKVWLGTDKKSAGPFKIEFMFTDYKNGNKIEKGNYKFELFLQNYLVIEYDITKLCKDGNWKMIHHNQFRDYEFHDDLKIPILDIK